MKIIAYIAAAIVIFFGILFIWGAFSPDGSPGWIPVGIISILIGFAIIWFVGRSKKSAPGTAEEVSYRVDLPANVNLDTLKCKSCGGSLTADNINGRRGASGPMSILRNDLPAH